MKDSKLISILRSLNTRERSRFREYVNSPFFNKHEALTILFDYILKSAPHFEDKTLDKKDAFEIIFSKDKYSEQRIYTLLSNLLELMNGYLAQLHFEEKILEQKCFTMAELRKRNELKQWQTVKKQYLILRDKNQFRGDEQEAYFQFFKESDALFIAQQMRQYDENLQLKSDSLDCFYITEKLKAACDMYSRNIVIKADYKSWELSGLLEAIEKDWGRFSKIHSIEVYFGILKMLVSGLEKDYREVKVLLKKHLGNFKQEETKVQFDYVINYIIRHLNSGRPDWYMEFLDLHRFLLDNEILMMDGILPEWDYKNIVTVALRADELNWAEEFIRNYREKLPEFVRDNAFNYNLAAFYFAAKDYKMALQLLQQVNFTDESYQLGLKIIQLKSYYELGEWETGISLISAFRQLVERSKSLSEYRKLSNLNMLKLAKKIISLSQDWDFLTDSAQRKGIENLEEALKKYQPQANLDWLMEKIEALKN